ncbi:MAG: tyrosine-type recombinase/integrase [Cetobacterium sp.]
MNSFNDLIEESDEILLMRKVYKHHNLKLQEGHLNQAFDLLINVLYVTFANTKFSNLVNKAESDPTNTAEIISRNIEKIIKIKEWSKSTSTVVFSAFKKLISETAISPIFIQKLSIIITPKMDRKSDEYCLPSLYKKHSQEHPGKKLLLSWINICKTITRNKSQTTLRQIISFSLLLSEKLGLDVDHFDSEKAKQIYFEDLKKTVEQLPMKMELAVRIRFATIIIKNFYKHENITYEQINSWSKSIPKNKKKEESETDLHRLSNKELELLYEASKSNPSGRDPAGPIRDELMILLMSTTGIRVGGLSNLMVNNVCKTIGRDIVINENAKTLEKGGKWFSFVLTPNTKLLLHKWITEHRKAHSQYLFPGRGDNPISTNRIGKIIKEIGERAGVTGPHVHPHALRHTFAHLLLESGNDPGLVSKMMGHSSSKTTEMYYLKESAVEASKRCNIPWLVKDSKPEALPTFLKNATIEKPIKLRSNKSQKNKALKLLAQDFRLLTTVKES